MGSSSMHIMVIAMNEDRMDEARNEAAEELGYDVETESEDESNEIYAKALSSAIETHIRAELIYNIYKYTCEPEDEQIAEMSVYIKAGEKFVSIDDLYELPVEELCMIEHYRIGLYLVFDKEIDIPEEYFLSLSDECSEQCSRIYYLPEEDGEYVYQGYAEGDYDTGYFSHGDEDECYRSSSDCFSFQSFLASKEQVVGN